MTKMSDNPSPSLLFEDHVDPAAPSSGFHRLFIDTDEKLKMIDHASLVTDFTPGGAGALATDTTWAAAGDLIVGTGNDAASILTKGAAGTVPTAGASTLAYAFPPGYEIDYVEITTGVAPTATSEATANTIITSSAIAYDGATTVMIEFFTSNARPAVATDADLTFALYDGASSIGKIGYAAATVAHYASVPILLRRRLTPSNATHTFSIRAYVYTGTASVSAQAGGATYYVPAYLRITKV